MPGRAQKPVPTDFGGLMKPPSSYLRFSGEKTKEISAEGKVVPLKERAKVVSDSWKALSEEEKRKFEEETQRLVAEWKPKNEEWEKTEGYKKFLEAKRVFDMKKGYKDAKKALKTSGAPKKPMTAWGLFLMDRRTVLMAKPDFPQGGKEKCKALFALTGVISEEWKKLTPEGKKPWEEKNALQKKEYDEAMVTFQQTDAWQSYQKSCDKVKNKNVKAHHDIKHAGKEHKLDADGNPIPFKMPMKRARKEPTAKEEPELDEEGNPIEPKQKKPRKPRDPNAAPRKPRAMKTKVAPATGEAEAPVAATEEAKEETKPDEPMEEEDDEAEDAEEAEEAEDAEGEEVEADA